MKGGHGIVSYRIARAAAARPPGTVMGNVPQMAANHPFSANFPLRDPLLWARRRSEWVELHPEAPPISACNLAIYRGRLAPGQVEATTGDRFTLGGRQRCLTYD
ncbi:hypothetical protein Pme01_51470 [Planosporangium mesophilum]|uniref:Uncharacterized protein n=1 Tax=Planosporangium mesophilum TaxID=689768 RepID=A0A8J3X2L0_9ACTN|nr:hypothetical protein Pme01_51470 [Planosporangium mesophilum]